MTNTATAARRTSRSAAATAPAGAPGLPVTPVRTRRKWQFSAAAIALIVVAALIGVFVFNAASRSEQVFVVGKSIERGATIDKSDLTTISITEGQGGVGIPAAKAGDVIGKVAQVDLPKGSLVTRDALGSGLPVPSGKALVGLALKPEQLPAQPLVAGDHVSIVPIAGNSTEAAVDASPPVSGIVSQSAPDEKSGLTVVDVYVSNSIAGDLAGRAAAGIIAIYIDGADD